MKPVAGIIIMLALSAGGCVLLDKADSSDEQSDSSYSETPTRRSSRSASAHCPACRTQFKMAKEDKEPLSSRSQSCGLSCSSSRQGQAIRVVDISKHEKSIVSDDKTDATQVVYEVKSGAGKSTEGKSTEGKSTEGKSTEGRSGPSIVSETKVVPAMLPPANDDAVVAQAMYSEVGEVKPPGPPMRLVNNHRISLNYEVKDIGPTGVSAIELWFTQDGRKWVKGDSATQARPPCVVEMKDDGIYGFTLLARNGVGIGKRPPMVGDVPQVWVCLDTTRPEIKLMKLQLASTEKSHQLTINWKAHDKHLTPQPITLYYSENADGPWTPIADQIGNNGSFVWQTPANVPHRFYMRAEAVDLAGNVGAAQTSEPFLIDTSQPSVRITTVDAANK